MSMRSLFALLPLTAVSCAVHTPRTADVPAEGERPAEAPTNPDAGPVVATRFPTTEELEAVRGCSMTFAARRESWHRITGELYFVDSEGRPAEASNTQQQAQ